MDPSDANTPASQDQKITESGEAARPSVVISVYSEMQ